MPITTATNERDGIVQILGKNNEHVGMGVYVGNQHVLTVAHNINIALGRAAEEVSSVPKKSTLHLSFLFPHPPQTATASVQKFGLELSDNNVVDLALLRLVEPAPENIKPAFFTSEPVTDDGWKAYGQRPKDTEPVWTSIGEISSATIGGRVQLDGVGVAGRLIDNGYSGAGVWNTRVKALVGLVDTRHKDIAANRVATMLPYQEIVKFYPELVDQSQNDPGRAESNQTSNQDDLIDPYKKIETKFALLNRISHRKQVKLFLNNGDKEKSISREFGCMTVFTTASSKDAPDIFTKSCLYEFSDWFQQGTSNEDLLEILHAAKDIRLQSTSLMGTQESVAAKFNAEMVEVPDDGWAVVFVQVSTLKSASEIAEHFRVWKTSPDHPNTDRKILLVLNIKAGSSASMLYRLLLRGLPALLGAWKLSDSCTVKRLLPVSKDDLEVWRSDLRAWNKQLANRIEPEIEKLLDTESEHFSFLEITEPLLKKL